VLSHLEINDETVFADPAKKTSFSQTLWQGSSSGQEV
jgi:hypothetical protein